MPVRQFCKGPRDDTAATTTTATSRIAAGQASVCDLRAGTSIVAEQGDLQLRFRDSSLAWLGDAVPPTSITLHEGEQFVTPQRGVVSISAAKALGALFVVQSPCVEKFAGGVVHQAFRHLAAAVKARLRRVA
jgi:hypothetical protein